MEDHCRTIIHIDIDCFYAQVEMVKQPHLWKLPMGVNQKNFLVTSNNLARQYGVQKGMYIDEAKKLCPQLVLVNGEDLYEYRQISKKIAEILKEYTHLVEKLGLDENFIDVSELVNNKMINQQGVKPTGVIFGTNTDLNCDCGCHDRINIASHIANEMREKIYQAVNLTTCAGISHNKLVAKLAGQQNKPNNQTVCYPDCAMQLMLSLEGIRKIPSIGQVASETLQGLGISTIQALQNSDLHLLEKHFDPEKAKQLQLYSMGVDPAPVKPTGKPQIISLEDVKVLYNDTEAEEKFKEFYRRLLVLIEEDGRIPKVIKITARKFGGTRETRQCNLASPLHNEEKVIAQAMTLFKKVIPTKTFKTTLLGLAFSKYVDKVSEKSTLMSFFSSCDKTVNKIETDPTQPKPRGLIESYFQNWPTKPKKQESSLSEDPGTSKSLKESNQLETHLSEHPQSKPQSPQKSHFNSKPETSASSQTPETKIKPKEGTLESFFANCPKVSKTDPEDTCKYPPGIDRKVFKELPAEIQEELWNDYKSHQGSNKDQNNKSGKRCKNTLMNFLVKKPKV